MGLLVVGNGNGLDLWKDFPLSILYNFGLSGVIHSKIYIWDNDTAYIGSQTFGHPFAAEMGLLFESTNVTIQVEKYYEFLKVLFNTYNKGVIP